MALLFADAATIALTSFISPYTADRAKARKIHDDKGVPFLEVYVQIEVEEAERRDPKGLYRKAREGVIKEFTGVSAPYEEPTGPEIRIESARTGVEEAVELILRVLEERQLLVRPGADGEGK